MTCYRIIEVNDMVHVDLTGEDGSSVFIKIPASQPEQVEAFQVERRYLLVDDSV